MSKHVLLLLAVLGGAFALSGCDQGADTGSGDTAQNTQEPGQAPDQAADQQPAPATESGQEDSVMGGLAQDTGAGEEHTASGTVESVDMQNARVTINHEPVDSAELPAMTMPFSVEDPQMLEGIEAGTEVSFTFTEGDAGQYVIEDIQEER